MKSICNYMPNSQEDTKDLFKHIELCFARFRLFLNNMES